MSEAKEQQPLTEAPEVNALPDAGAPESNPNIIRREYVINGRPQVFEGTPDEVMTAMEEAHRNAASRMQEWRQKATLDQPEPDIEYKPRALTTEERYALVNQLSDPLNVDAAYDRLFESRVGVTPEKYREELNRGRKAERENRELQAAMSFMSEHPEYTPCPENRQALDAFFAAKKLPVTKNNLDFAFEELRDTLVLQNSEQQHNAVPVPPAAAQKSAEAITSDTPAPAVTTRPRGTLTTGLQSKHGSSKTAGWDTRRHNEEFAAEVNKLSSVEYKRRYNSDPSFRARVDALTATKR